MKSPTKSRFVLAITAALALILGLLNPTAAFAGNDGMLSTTLTAKNSSVYSGDSLVYEAQLSCSDPAGCADVTLHFSKPDAVKPGAKGSVMKPYPPGVDSVVENSDGSIDVIYSATAAGLVSQLTVSWPTENLTTPPGDQTTTMTVSQPGEPDTTREATIKLLADSDLTINKAGAPTTQPDQNYTYTINTGVSFPDPGDKSHGALSYTGAVLVDPLPAEAVYVGSSMGGVYDPNTHTVTWSLGNLQSGKEVIVTVRYPAPVGGEATYLNTATLTATQIGSTDSTRVESTSPVTVRVNAPSYRTTASKTGTPLIADGVQTFEIVATNRGNLNTDITITDPIPEGLTVTAVNRGSYGSSVKPGSTVEFHYADGTSSGPLDFATPKVNVPAGTPRVTSIVAVLRQVDVDATVALDILSVADWAVIGAAKSLTNCATIETTGADDSQRQCATIEISPVAVPSPSINKAAGQAPVGPGGTMTWTVGITNSENNTTPLMPVVYDSIPNQLSFVPGSLRAVSGNGTYCLAAADFEEDVLPDWNQAHGTPFTTGPRTTVRWTYTGDTGLVIPKWQPSCLYEYDTIVKAGVAAGTYSGSSLDPSYRGNVIQIFDRDVRVPASSSSWLNDIFDGDGDGDTTEMAPRAGASFAIADTAAAWIEKKVTGDQDNGHWFDSAEKKGKKDEVGTSTPGGTVSYQVRLGNLGNRNLMNLVAYDLLPVPGNPGVTNGRYAQNPPGAGNEWTPTMKGPITNPAPGSLSITYSVKTDPCRPEMDNSDAHTASFFCNGQQDSSWQSADQVTDWSEIRSVRFDFGNKVFVGGEFVDLEWTMATPTTLADGSSILGGERTWNRVALDSVQALDGSPMLAAEAPWVVDQMATPADPAISIEKWSTADGFPAGDFDTAPGKAVEAKTPTAITMTITNTGAEALRDVTVTDDSLDGPALSDLSCDFSSLGGAKTGTTWAGPFAVGASFDCTGTVPGLPSNTTHGDNATVTGAGVGSGIVVTDEDPWFATSETLFAIGDYTWIDANKNGIQDTDEAPIAGVVVVLYDTDGTEISRTTTDATGYYHFDGLAAGDYSLGFSDVEGYTRTIATQGTDPTVDSDADQTTGRTAVVHLDTGAENITPSKASDGVNAPFINRTIDAGYVSVPVFAIGDYTWIDANANGIQDAGEVPIGGVLVILIGADGTEIARTTTDAHGYYHFDRLPAGDYSLAFGEVPGYQRTPSTQGSDATVDSDADVTTGRTVLIHLDVDAANVTASTASDGVTAPFINRTIDAGYVSLVPAIDIEKWSTNDGLVEGDFDTAPGKSVEAGTATAITMTITNTGNEALTKVHVTDTTLAGPAMIGLSCDFSSLGGPATGVNWDGPFEIGASFECTGEVPGMDAATAHIDEAAVTAEGAATGVAVQDADQWHAKTPKGAAPAPFDGPGALAVTGGVIGGAGLAAVMLLLGLVLLRRRRSQA